MPYNFNKITQHLNSNPELIELINSVAYRLLKQLLQEMPETACFHIIEAETEEQGLNFYKLTAEGKKVAQQLVAEIHNLYMKGYAIEAIQAQHVNLNLKALNTAAVSNSKQQQYVSINKIHVPKNLGLEKSSFNRPSSEQPLSINADEPVKQITKPIVQHPLSSPSKVRNKCGLFAAAAAELAPAKKGSALGALAVVEALAIVGFIKIGLTVGLPITMVLFGAAMLTCVAALPFVGLMSILLNTPAKPSQPSTDTHSEQLELPTP